MRTSATEVDDVEHVGDGARKHEAVVVRGHQVGLAVDENALVVIRVAVDCVAQVADELHHIAHAAVRRLGSSATR